MTLRVAIDARRALWMGHTGIGRYVRNLLEHGAVDPAVELVALTARGQCPPAGGQAIRPGLSQAGRIVWEQLSVPARVARGRFDALHLPWYEGSPAAPVGVVLTIQDLHTLHAPREYAPAFRAYYNGLLRLLVRRAAVVVVPSRSTAADVAAAWPRAAPRIRVSPYGHDSALVGARGESGAPLGSTGRILYCGGYGPRKRLDVVVDAFSQVLHRQPGARLQLTGDVPSDVLARCAELGVMASLDRLGRVSDAALREAFAAADACVYVSDHEGFGFPALEALTAGVPLVATRSSSIPEIAGDAAALVEPGDAPATAGALERALAAGADVRAEVERGRERALGFTWARCWNEHAAAYAEAA